MSVRQKQSIFLLILGELLLIICFAYFAGHLPTEKLVLNIVVASLVYLLMFMDLLLPWVDRQDVSQRQIGSLGIRWTFTFIYQLAAVGLMVFFLIDDSTSFRWQLLFQAILFFIFLVGIFISFTVSDRVADAHQESYASRSGIEQMRKAAKQSLAGVSAMADAPTGIATRLERMAEDIRYLSPGNGAQTRALEQGFTEEMRRLSRILSEQPLQEQELNRLLQSCESMLKERRQSYAQ